MIFLWKHFKTMIYLQNNVEKWLKKTSSYTEGTLTRDTFAGVATLNTDSVSLSFKLQN